MFCAMSNVSSTSSSAGARKASDLRLLRVQLGGLASSDHQSRPQVSQSFGSRDAERYYIVEVQSEQPVESMSLLPRGKPLRLTCTVTVVSVSSHSKAGEMGILYPNAV